MDLVEEQHMHTNLLLYRFTNQNKRYFVYVRDLRIFYCKCSVPQVYNTIDNKRKWKMSFSLNAKCSSTFTKIQQHKCEIKTYNNNDYQNYSVILGTL